jgi:CheY-like chemotaxis protein
MDVHMPGMDGLAAARAIRALPGPHGAVPIVALSADVLPEQIARCRLRRRRWTTTWPSRSAATWMRR